MPYAALQAINDASAPAGLRACWKFEYLRRSGRPRRPARDRLYAAGRALRHQPRLALAGPRRGCGADRLDPPLLGGAAPVRYRHGLRELHGGGRRRARASGVGSRGLHAALGAQERVGSRQVLPAQPEHQAGLSGEGPPCPSTALCARTGSAVGSTSVYRKRPSRSRPSARVAGRDRGHAAHATLRRGHLAGLPRRRAPARADPGAARSRMRLSRHQGFCRRALGSVLPIESHRQPGKAPSLPAQGDRAPPLARTRAAHRTDRPAPARALAFIHLKTLFRHSPLHAVRARALVERVQLLAAKAIVAHGLHCALDAALSCGLRTLAGSNWKPRACAFSRNVVAMRGLVTRWHLPTLALRIRRERAHPTGVHLQLFAWLAVDHRQRRRGLPEVKLRDREAMLPVS